MLEATRRRFLLGTGALVLCASAFPQYDRKVFRVGYPSLRSTRNAADEAFLQGLQALGYMPGRNLAVEYRFANNDYARFRADVDELVRSKVDVIVTASSPAVRIAMQSTRTIPIVMAAAADPAGTGLVASLVHPGGNVTGFSFLSTDLARKRFQLLGEIVPGVVRVGFLGQVPPTALATGRSATELVVAEIEAAGRETGIEVSTQIVADEDGLPRAWAEFQQRHIQALFVQTGPLTYEHRAAIVGTAARERLPDLYENRLFVDAGGLISYGPDVEDLFRRAAGYVDRILRGAKPGDLPVEQPTRFELIVNLGTAQALGVAVPQTVLLRANEVIR